MPGKLFHHSGSEQCHLHGHESGRECESSAQLELADVVDDIRLRGFHPDGSGGGRGEGRGEVRAQNYAGVSRSVLADDWIRTRLGVWNAHLSEAKSQAYAE